ncbi:MAG: hypothetical protein MUF60_11555 [Vicinamibacterales bacterium]|nr:hypothetical protein [Vicinamibacterales bacterium]
MAAGRAGGDTTICTITINSSDEVRALRAAAPSARFVELTDFASGGDQKSGWLGRACEAGIQCDVLLISGHFANTFFGESAFELPLRELEREACGHRCPGVLSRPRVVFLFGCNTLAAKDTDRRSPEAYRALLIGDGLQPRFADRVVALRYGPLGEETRERMRKVFGLQAVLLGFSSVGPVGAVAGPVFRAYLRDVRADLHRLFDEPSPGPRERRRLERAWLSAFAGMNPAAATGAESPTADECAFDDLDAPRAERLRRAERLMAADPLRYTLRVWDFLRAQDGWEPSERAVLDRLRDQREARRQVLAVLPHLTNSLGAYFSALRLARFLGWMEEQDYARRRDARVRALLADGASAAERDFLCANAVPYAPPATVLAGNRGNTAFLEVLPCLSEFLLSHLAHRSPAVVLAALESLAALDLLEPRDSARLRQLYEVSGGDVRAAVLWALAAGDGESPTIRRFVASAVGETDPDVAWTAVKVLEAMRSNEVDVLRPVVAALDRADGFVRRAAALALESLAPLPASLLTAVTVHADDPDEIVRGAIGRAAARSRAR